MHVIFFLFATTHLVMTRPGPIASGLTCTMQTNACVTIMKQQCIAMYIDVTMDDELDRS